MPAFPGGGAVLPMAAQAPATAAGKMPAFPGGRGWQFQGSFRLRQELWDWFAPRGGLQNSYTFTAALLKLGVTHRSTRDLFSLELVQPTLINLPTRATGPAPIGQMGHGAAYFDANDGQDAGLFVGQAFWEGRPFGMRDRLRIGRFEFSEGVEADTPTPDLTWLHAERIGQRLIGPFAFTHISRRLDGFRLLLDRGRTRYTVAGGIPTRGAFDLNGMDTLPQVRYGYAAVTKPLSPKKPLGDARLFALYYNDARDGVKTDNRPAAIRATDRDAISITTLGGHAVRLWDLPAGRVDALVWAAGQVGDWGRLAHRAWAASGEVGFQPKGWAGRPWFRAGLNHYSGDGDPADGSHGTFFSPLNTPRIYARFPFFTQLNLSDAFVQAILRPSPQWTLRADFHQLRLADAADLWYAGGGAFQDRPSFGFGGRPSGGSGDLARLVDFSATYRPRRDTDLTLYLGHAVGGDVIGSSYQHTEGFFGYFEILRRF